MLKITQPEGIYNHYLFNDCGLWGGYIAWAHVPGHKPIHWLFYLFMKPSPGPFPYCKGRD